MSLFIRFQNSNVLKPNLQSESIGGDAFGSSVGDDGRVLMNGISALKKRDWRKLPCLLYHIRTQQKDSCLILNSFYEILESQCSQYLLLDK